VTPAGRRRPARAPGRWLHDRRDRQLPSPDQIVESVLTELVPSVGRYLPGAAGMSLAGSSDTLPAAGAALLLVAYALAAAAAGWGATVRRDVA
jgi:hypothetical protein